MKRIIAIVVMLVMVLSLSSAFASSDVILTAINDSFIELTQDTMPVLKYGDWYVPYKTFASGGTSPSPLGLFASHNVSQNNLFMYDGNGKTLTFETSIGFVYDENKTYYSQPAYPINGTIYLPVKTVCNKFGLSFSYIKEKYPILRIISYSAISNSLFSNVSENIAEQMIDKYNTKKSQSNSNTSTNPNPSTPEINIPTDTEIFINPSSIYLTFDGDLTDYTKQILLTLKKYSTNATFFITKEDILKNDDIVRHIIANGNSIGIYIPSDILDSPQDITEYLSQANEDLIFITGIKTRLISTKDLNYDDFSEETLNVLTENGYILWSYSSKPTSSSSSRISKDAIKTLRNTSNRVIFRFNMNKSSANALNKIVYEIFSRRLNVYVLSEVDRP